MLRSRRSSNSLSESKVPHQTELADNETQRYRLKCRTFLGFFYIFLCSITYVLSGVIIRRLLYINPAQLSSIRTSYIFFGCLPIAIFYVKDSFCPKGYGRILILRGIIIGSVNFFNAMTFRYLPLVEAIIITSTTPAITIFAARFYLKEPCGIVPIIAMLLTLCGFFLSTRLPQLVQGTQTAEIDLFDYIMGVCFGILYVLFLSAGTVILGKLRHIHFTIPALYSSVFSCFGSGIISSFISSYAPPLCGLDQWLVILMGILYFISTIAYILAIQLETIAVVVIIKESCDIIFSALFETFVLKVKPNTYTLFGAALVLLSTFILSARKFVSAMPDESKNSKKTFKFLLM